MTRTPTTISRTKTTVPGLDYASLRAEAIRLTHAMSDQAWTDYNYSDPGVTIIEQLCYALTELPYRASIPVQDLLIAEGDSVVDIRRQGLMPASSILPCNPVTANDLRRVVIDRIPQVANVWFTPVDPASNRGLSGLYDVAILARGDLDETPGDDGCCDDDALIERVLSCYRGHRALCEDVREARVLTQIDTYVHAWIELEGAADPSETLAAALFALGLYLAPEPQRRSLDDELAAAGATADMFSGPAMARGFISDDQLTPLPDHVQTDHLAQLLAELPGILTVARLEVEAGIDERRYTGDDMIEVPPGSILWLQGRTREGGFTIHMTRSGATCRPNAARVRRLLDQYWGKQRQTYPVQDDYLDQYGPPEATWRDLERYTSVQTQFPRVYGINAAGLPPGATKARQAQARQLKGYLMPFDQLMADYFSQLAFVRSLFSIEAGGKTTYAHQSLEDIVPDAKWLLNPHYDEGLARLADDADQTATRQKAVLDLLLSLYAQGITVDQTADADASRPDAAAMIKARQEMLRHVSTLSRNRGRGADYRRLRAATTVAGVERLSRVELIMLDVIGDDAASKPERNPKPGDAPRRPSQSDRLWTASDNGRDASFGVRLPEELWATLPRLFDPVQLNPADPVSDEPSPLDGHRVAESLADALSDPDRYRIGKAPQSTGIYIVCIDMRGGWWWLGEQADEERAIDVIRRLLRDSRDQPVGPPTPVARPELYIIDWILLRFALLGDSGQGARFNFRVTAVLSADRADWQSPPWRDDAETILRRNTPAHIRLDCLFLDPPAMRRFERLHVEWADALRHCHHGRQVQASRALERFLIDALTPFVPPPAKPPEPVPPQPPAPPPKPPAPPTAPPTPAGPTPSVEPAEAADQTPVPPGPVAPAPAGPPPPSAADAEPLELTTTVYTPSHPVRDWLSWFWSTWLWPTIKLFAAIVTGVWLVSRVRTWLAGRGITIADPPNAADDPVAAAPPPPPPSPPPPASTQAPEVAPEAPPLPTAPPPTAPPLSTIPTLPGRVSAAPSGTLGFDANTVLTEATARSFADAGFAFAVRYVPRTFVVSPGDAQGNLTRDEAEVILGTGLALMAVQHVASAGWVPSATLGESYGAIAAQNAQAIGLPPGINIWLDLEGVASGTAPSVIEDYCAAWYAQVARAGYVPGLYVGANCGLSADQIMATPFRYFWQSGSKVPAPASGFCMIQTIDNSYVLDGVAYDLDVTQADAGGRTPLWLAPQ